MIQKGKLDGTKEQSGNIEGAIRRYHIGNQRSDLKMPTVRSEDNKGVIRKKRKLEDIKGTIRGYNRGNNE
jgi:hypothetical protein